MKGCLSARFEENRSTMLMICILVGCLFAVSAANAIESQPEAVDGKHALIDTVSVYISNKAAPAGMVFRLPLYVKEDVESYGILSMQFRMVVNPNLLSFRTAVPGDVVPEGNLYEFGFAGDTIIVTMASAEKFEGVGSLADVEFHVDGSAQDGQTTVLTVEQFLFNEAPVGPAAIIHNGIFIVGSYPDIELSASNYVFGEVNVGGMRDTNLVISNIGWADLIIASITGTNQDFGVTGQSFPLTIEPGADADVSITFTPTQVGDRQGSLTITSNDYFEHEVYISLSGVGVAPDIALSSREYSFGQVTVGYGSNWEFEVYNVGNAKLMINSVLVYPAVFRAPSPVFPYDVDPGDTLRVTAQFFPDEVGQAAGVLTLSSNDPDEPTIDVFLSGVGIPPVADILIAESTYDFGGVYLGTAATWSMPIANVGTAPLTITSIESSQEEYSITAPVFPRTIQPMSSITAGVSFQPETEESISATLTVNSDDPDEPQILVTVSGYGAAPAVMTVQGGLGNPGTVASQVPIAMENQEAIASVEFVLGFSDEVMTPMAAIPTARSEDLETFQVDLGYDIGKTKLTISGLTQSILAGSGPFAKFAFSIASDAPSGDYPLTLSEVSAVDVHGSEVSFVLQDSIFAIRPVGIEDDAENPELPRQYALCQNYPNPFNPGTDIRYQISDTRSPVYTTLTIYNLLGQEVRVLVNEMKKPGYYSVAWDGIDAFGRAVPSGIYLYRLETANFVATKKMILAR